MPDNGWEPVIVGFTCNWCSYRAADAAGMARVKYAPNVRLIRLMCSGRVDPQFVLKALAEGADGVLITGCHPGDCHTWSRTTRPCAFELLKKTLAQMGVGTSVKRSNPPPRDDPGGEIDKFVAEIKLGPLQ
jgi:F420-non-reducing hydrogenase iron-sulfur subunit